MTVDVAGDAAVPVSVGVLAYNEEHLIGRCLGSILAQHTAAITVAEVLVISSGCTDSTDDIVRRIAATDPRVTLVTQPDRLGKVVAEMAFFSRALHDICVVTSGDIVAATDTLELLCAPLVLDPTVGMTGARPVPAVTSNGIPGRLHQTLWALHDEVARVNPKLGEMVAVRRTLAVRLTAEAGCDEVLLERLSLDSGLSLRYVPGAVVTNFGPTSLLQYAQQRSRVYRQHLTVRATTGYRPSTMGYGTIASSVVRYVRRNPGSAWFVLVCGVLELCARAAAKVRPGPEIVWQPTTTSRGPVAMPPDLENGASRATIND